MITLSANISSIVKKYRGDMTIRDFAAALSDAGYPIVSFTRQSVYNWEQGMTPDPVKMMIVKDRASDWRRDFALDVLAAIEK